jgi:hypothetical protein
VNWNGTYGIPFKAKPDPLEAFIYDTPFEPSLDGGQLTSCSVPFLLRKMSRDENSAAMGYWTHRTV